MNEKFLLSISVNFILFLVVSFWFTFVCVTKLSYVQIHSCAKFGINPSKIVIKNNNCLEESKLHTYIQILILLMQLEPHTYIIFFVSAKAMFYLACKNHFIKMYLKLLWSGSANFCMPSQLFGKFVKVVKNNSIFILQQMHACTKM